jgi:hypothetical protein
MGSKEFLDLLSYVEIALCIVALCFLIFRGLWRQYWALGTLLLVRALSGIISSLTVHLSGKSLDKHLAYQIYFYVYWTTIAIECLLTFLILYCALRLVLNPLRRLQRLGSRIFSVITIFCIAIAAFIPSATSIYGVRYLVGAVSQLQLVQDAAVFGLLLFMLFAARALGLSYRSIVVAVTVGLGTLAAMDMVRIIWFTHHPQAYSQFNMANAIARTVVAGLWALCLALPEPPRRDVKFAADSALARWN